MPHPGEDFLTTLSDADLLTLYALRGKFFEEFDRRFRSSLLRWCHRLCPPGNSEFDAEDLCQETLCRAALRAATFDRRRAVLPWLRAIARHLAIDHSRRRANRPTLVRMEGAEAELCEPHRETMAAHGGAHAAKETTAKLVEAIRQLPPPLRAAYLRRDVDGLPYNRLYQLLGIRPGTAASRVHRARWQLREALSAHRADFAEFGIDWETLVESLA